MTGPTARRHRPAPDGALRTTSTRDGARDAASARPTFSDSAPEARS